MKKGAEYQRWYRKERTTPKMRADYQRKYRASIRARTIELRHAQARLSQTESERVEKVQTDDMKGRCYLCRRPLVFAVYLNPKHTKEYHRQCYKEVYHA